MAESIYRKLYTKFWSDSKVAKMTFEERYLFLYLMTSPHSNSANCYELPIEQASRELGLHDDEIIKLLESLRDKWRIIDYNKQLSEVLVCNRAKYDWVVSPSTLTGIKKQCKNIKTKIMKDYIDFLTNHGYGESNWDNSICDYYSGEWRDLIKEQ